MVWPIFMGVDAEVRPPSAPTSPRAVSMKLGENPLASRECVRGTTAVPRFFLTNLIQNLAVPSKETTPDAIVNFIPGTWAKDSNWPDLEAGIRNQIPGLYSLSTLVGAAQIRPMTDAPQREGSIGK